MRKILKNLLKVLKGEHDAKDAWYYLQGKYRYKLYYSKNPYVRIFMRRHIRAQIEYRIRVMDFECYQQGQCKICKCDTTALQMADKSCDKPCYPPMMKKTEWNSSFLKGMNHVLKNKS